MCSKEANLRKKTNVTFTRVGNDRFNKSNQRAITVSQTLLNKTTQINLDKKNDTLLFFLQVVFVPSHSIWL